VFDRPCDFRGWFTNELASNRESLADLDTYRLEVILVGDSWFNCKKKTGFINNLFT
jgi:hypothetical protein